MTVPYDTLTTMYRMTTMQLLTALLMLYITLHIVSR